MEGLQSLQPVHGPFCRPAQLVCLLPPTNREKGEEEGGEEEEGRGEGGRAVLARKTNQKPTIWFPVLLYTLYLCSCFCIHSNHILRTRWPEESTIINNGSSYTAVLATSRL